MSAALSTSSLELIPVDYDPFATGELAMVVPTTEAQREIWLANELGTEAALTFNLAVSLRLRGGLDRNALADALQILVDRHDALRASFGPDGETLCIRKSLRIELPFTDLAALPAAERAKALETRLRASVETPFRIESDPLFRAELIRLGGEEHVLLLGAHHIICDGWSWGVIVQELGQIYGQRRGIPGALGKALPPIERFTDFALAEVEHLQSPEHAADEAFWLSRFADGIPVLELPTDRPRPKFRSFASARVDHVLDADLTARIRELGARRGVSLFATLLAGFAGLLTRLTGQSRVVVGIPAAGQPLDGRTNLVGHCVNTLPLRFDNDVGRPFTEAVDAAQSVLLEALEHQRYTFGTLLKKLPIRRDPSRIPLVSVLFNLDRGLDHDMAFPGLSLEMHDVPRSFDNFELFVNTAQVHGTLRLECQYNRDLFDEATVRRWLTAYETMFRALCAAPETLLGDADVLCAEDRASLAQWNSTAVPMPAERTLPALLSAQAARTPDRAALRFGDGVLTFQELDRRSNRIANALVRRGVRPRDLVGVYLDRHPDLVATMIGVLKAGAAYVPMDPAYPLERLRFMAEDASLALVVSEGDLASALDWPVDKLLRLDADPNELASTPDAPLATDLAAPDAPAYVIFTSGSTGRPKGVVVPHGAVVNFLASMRKVPGLGPDDRLLAVTTTSFDIAVLELFLPLTTGAEVVLATRDQALSGSDLAALIDGLGVTVMQATPSTWRLLVESGWRGSPRFKALCGGEAFPADLAIQLTAICGEVWNMYGPTETTVWSTCARVTQKGGIPDLTIGKPIDNTTVWVLDPRGQRCPIGVPGEIYIGGDGVTLGYLNRPELTAERFVPDPFVPRGSGEAPRLYRTGDRGRWRSDGQLEHLGRLDSQVKVRGYRIELGEIEAVLASHPSVARAVVVTHEVRPSDVRLVGYVVPAPGAKADVAVLVEHLRSALPQYMLPQHLLVLDTIPLLPNGKVDRRSLPVPQDTGAPRAFVAPRTPVEEAIAEIWCSILGIDRVGVDDDFFELGGHSLSASRVITRVRKRFEADVPLRVIFEGRTLRALAEAVAAATAKAAAPEQPDATIAPVPRNAPVRLSFSQRRMWLLHAIDPGGAAYNVWLAFDLRGALDRVVLARSLERLFERHEVFRTTFRMDEQEPVAIVAERTPVVPIEEIDLRSAPDRHDRARAELQRISTQPFDLAKGPLHRVALVRLGEAEHQLLLVMHHIIVDNWALGILKRELETIYNALIRGQEPVLPERTIDFADYAASERKAFDEGRVASQVDFWMERLRGLAPLDLPRDTMVLRRESARGGVVRATLSTERLDRLHRFCARRGLSPFMVTLAAFQWFLARYCGQTDIAVASPSANRSLPEAEQLVGTLVNTLVMRTDVDGVKAFEDLLERVRDTVLTAVAHQDVPYDYLIDRLRAEGVIEKAFELRAFFNVFNAPQDELRLHGITATALAIDLDAVQFDLALDLDTSIAKTAALTYSSELFERTTAERMLEGYLALLDRLLEAPEQPLGSIGLALPQDLAEMDAWNATRVPLPEARTIPGLLGARAGLCPQATALIETAEGSVTYAELWSRVYQWAHLLRQHGVRRGHLVGLYVERGISMVVMQLAVLVAGAAYVPLDPAYPTERLQFMMDDARLELLITHSSLATMVRWPRERTLFVDIDASRAEEAPTTPPAPDPQADACPEDPAYVIYTSGSTGKPKGVVVHHEAVVNFLASMAKKPGLASDDRLLAVTTLSFDIAVLELLLPLSVGASIVIASREEATDGTLLCDLVAEHGVTVMQATPATWRMLVEADFRGRPGFKALIGGEALPADLARELLQRVTELWNMYGPTETTVWSTCWKVEHPERGISIGRPIDNTEIHILDPGGNRCPIGVAGEVFIGGEGVTLGYLHRPELTSERFVVDPFRGEGKRMYRTGDRGRWRRDGQLEHLGRLDFQVKVRGHRIELGEIESALMNHPDVARTVVIVREDRPGDARLVAYVVPRGGVSTLGARALREHLRTTLPAYMVPQHFVELPDIPRLPNGKINRAALPVPTEAPSGSGEDAAAPVSEAEKTIALVWKELLGITQVSKTDNFFDLGGHSLLAMRAIAEIHRRLGVRFEPRRLIFESLGQLAASVGPAPGAKADNGARATPAPATPPSATTEPRLSSEGGSRMRSLLGRLKAKLLRD
jgi:amino acid adenylation domain-containing protein